MPLIDTTAVVHLESEVTVIVKTKRTVRRGERTGCMTLSQAKKQNMSIANVINPKAVSRILWSFLKKRVTFCAPYVYYSFLMFYWIIQL